jgi:HEAT repeat protein
MTTRHIAIPSLLVFALASLALAGTSSIAFAQAPAQAPASAAAPAAPAAPASLDAILKQVALYDGGIESAALWQLRDYVNARKDDAAGRAECEAKLLAFLKTPASPVARMAACRYLRLIAGDTAVPALQAMLTDEKSADLALYALQGISGGTAEKALLQSLGVTTGATKLEILAALGERRSVAAIPVVAPLLQQAAFAPAAAVALGRIGGEAAVAPLMAALPGAAPTLKPVVAGALLEAADALMAAKNTGAALRIYESLASDTTLPTPQRRAALSGRILSTADARRAVLDMLASPDALAREAALSHMPATYFPDTIVEVCALLPKLAEGEQIVLIAALAPYPVGPVVPALLAAAGSSSDAVRLAALKALGQVGEARGQASGAGHVAFLAERSAATKGPEQAAARSALASLKGRAVDDEILAQLGKKPADPIAGELLLAIGDRRIYAAKGIVAAALKSPSPAIRLQASRGLRTIGTPSDIPAALDALLAATNEAEQGEAEKTVVALGQKTASPDGRARMVRMRLAMEKAPASRVALIGVIGVLGDPSTLPVLRAALRDENADVYDAAIRALAGWPTAVAREDLLALARDTRAETHRLLAIRGLIRVIGLEPFRDPRAAVEDLRLAAGFAWRPDEQKLVLSALTQFPCAEALEMATGFLREPLVKAEARAAIDRLSRLPREGSRK